MHRSNARGPSVVHQVADHAQTKRLHSSDGSAANLEALARRQGSYHMVRVRGLSADVDLCPRRTQRRSTGGVGGRQGRRIHDRED
jgi:hypothetical protein